MTMMMILVFLLLLLPAYGTTLRPRIYHNNEMSESVSARVREIHFVYACVCVVFVANEATANPNTIMMTSLRTTNAVGK